MNDQECNLTGEVQNAQHPLSSGKKGKKMQNLYHYLALAVFTFGIAAFPVKLPSSEVLSARTSTSQPVTNIRMRF